MGEGAKRVTTVIGRRPWRRELENTSAIGRDAPYDRVRPMRCRRLTCKPAATLSRTDAARRQLARIGRSGAAASRRRSRAPRRFQPTFDISLVDWHGWLSRGLAREVEQRRLFPWLAGLFRGRHPPVLPGRGGPGLLGAAPGAALFGGLASRCRRRTVALWRCLSGSRSCSPGFAAGDPPHAALSRRRFSPASPSRR